MPNHVINILSFEGDKTKIRQMLEDIKDDECGLHSVDFNKIIGKHLGRVHELALYLRV